MEITKTERGLDIKEFTDIYGHKCSLQESSFTEEHAIWLGVNNTNPQILASDSEKLGIKTEYKDGWIPFPIPEEVSLYSRMHLSQKMVKELLPKLIQFAETGSLTATEEAQNIVEGTLFNCPYPPSNHNFFLTNENNESYHVVNTQTEILNELLLITPHFYLKNFKGKLKYIAELDMTFVEIILEDSIAE
jgi:hypothetical protein